MADGAFSLVDFKSSSGIFSEMFLQVGGYAIAYEEEHGREFEKMMIIQFGKETGEFQVKQSSDTAKDKEAFLSALSLKRRILELDYQ